MHGDRRLLDAVQARLLAAGARVSSSPSKLARALRRPDPGARHRRADPRQRRRRAGDVPARAGGGPRGPGPAGARRTPRTRCTRCGSAAGGCGRCSPPTAALLDAASVAPLREELRWLGEVLGAARDSEVVRDQLRAEVAELPADLVLGPVEQRIVETFGARYRRAHDDRAGGDGRRAVLRAARRPRRAGHDPTARPAAPEPAGEVLLPPARPDLPAHRPARRRGARAAGRRRPRAPAVTRSASRPSGPGTPGRPRAGSSATRRTATARR